MRRGSFLRSFVRRLQQGLPWLLIVALLTSTSPLTIGPARAASVMQAEPVTEQQEPGFLYLPSALKKAKIGLPCEETNSCPIANGSALVVGTVFDAKSDKPLAGAIVTVTGFSASAQTDSEGFFSLALPPGEYDLGISKNGFTADERSVTAIDNQSVRVQDVLLLALDPKTATLDAAGGTLENSLGNSSLEFPAGALATSETIRVTYLPNDALPGDFPNGQIPMGFSYFEPGDLVFPQGKEVLWTVEYNGDLPVGTDTLCYWWDGASGTWIDPVPGKVVLLENGKKALQAKIPHFAPSSRVEASGILQQPPRGAAYGHALPAVAGQKPGGGKPVVGKANAGQGEGTVECHGCAINVGTGAVSEGYAFQPVSSKGFPVVLVARYSTANDTPTVRATVPFTITSQFPASAEWRIDFQGQVYTGEGFSAEANWDTRNPLGFRVSPGLYSFTASETFIYDSGARPTLDVDGIVEVRRGDIWPFGRNWMTSYDTLIVDHGDTATIIQGDGQYLTYTREDNGSYTPAAGDFSKLVRAGDDTWTRTSSDGFKESFDANGRLTRLEDRNGNAHTLAYEPNGANLANGQWGLTTRLASITDASGRTTAFTYDSNGYISKVTDPLNRVYELSHDAAGNLTSITDPLDRTTSYQYDDAGLLTHYTYPKGNATTLAYDNRRRMTSHTDAQGETRSATYTNSGNTFTDERGNATIYTPNEVGAIARVKTPAQTTNLSFNEARQLVGVDEPQQRFVYDEQGNLTRVNGFTTNSFTYEPTFNQLASATDGVGNTTRFAYDDKGNLVSITDALGHVSHYGYDAAGQNVSATDALNNTVRVEYNAFGNVSKEISLQGFETDLAYDEAGNLIGQTDAEEHTTSYAYDDRDRRSSMTDALGHVSHYEYDANSNLVHFTDARNNGSTYAYDGLDRLLSKTNALNQATSYGYDAVGNLTGITDANGATIAYTYDAANRLVQESYPEGGGATYEYDGVNGLSAFANATIQSTSTFGDIPGMADVVATQVVGNDNIASTITYDYVSAGGIGAASATATEAQAAASAPPEWFATPTEPPPAAAQSEAWTMPPNTAEMSAVAQAAYSETPTAVDTDICGTISANTTWTLANSPYVVTCDVTVASGVTVNIEPGVVVKFPACCLTLYVNGTLIADATEANPITFTSIKDDAAGGDTNGDGGATQPAPGDWGAVRFTNTSVDSVLDYVIVRYGGGYWTHNAYANTSDITITNSTFSNGYGNGLMLDNALPASLTGNKFLNNTDSAVWAPLNGNDDSITLSGNSASGNRYNAFVTAGNIGGNVTWDGDDNLPFLIYSDFTVSAGAKLTLTPRTVVKIVACCVTVYVNGTLVADTDAANPIIFTSFKDDSVGGDTNNDGNGSQPAAGDWGALRFANSSVDSVLNYAVVRYGGGYWTHNVYVNTSDITITNSTFSNGYGNGLMVEGASITLTGNKFLNNSDSAVWAPLNNSNNSFTLSGNSASGNRYNAFVTAGSISGNVTWDGDDNLPFLIWTDFTVNAGGKLTLTPRSVVKFSACCVTFYVNGTFVADAAAPITFTSLKDDSVGGDTNNDGNVSKPAIGDWGAIRFSNTSEDSVLNYAVVRYGGGYWTHSVYANTNDIVITNNTFSNSYGSGLSLEGSSPNLSGNSFVNNGTGVYIYGGAAPVLHNNEISGNSQFGVQNAGGAALINAENNWWGSSSGPVDTSDDSSSGGLYNPNGAGDRVSDGVDYDPWLQVTGLVYGVSIATGNNPVQNVGYDYDALNRLSGLTAAGDAAFAYAYEYDDADRLTEVDPAQGSAGVHTSFTYDKDSRITRVINRSPNGNTTFNDFRYTSDKVGNFLTMQDGNGTTTYGYDAISQLTSANGPGINESYAYDAVGNRTSKNGITYSYDAANRLTSSSDGTTYTYDNNGNLLTKTAGGKTTSYRWDVKDRLVRIDFADDTFAAYAYDAFGRRASKRDRNGVTTYYIYDGLDLVQEVDDQGDLLASYVYDNLDNPLSMTRGGQSYYYLYDRLGNVVGLTNGAGELVVSYRYDPWGNIIATGGSNPDLPNPFRFTAREWDAESGLYFYRARYYEPLTGRFISPDPLDTKTVANRYLYVGNNPASYVDPLGMGPNDPDDQAKARMGGGGLVVVGGMTAGSSAMAVSGTSAFASAGLVGKTLLVATNPGVVAGVVLIGIGYCIYRAAKPPAVPRLIQKVGEELSAPIRDAIARSREIVKKFNGAGGKDQFTKEELGELAVVMERLTPEQRREVLEKEGVPYQKYVDVMKEYNLLPDHMK